MEEKLIGKIIHYYPKINVGVLKLEEGNIALGDKIHIKGKSTDFEQEVESMQYEHKNIEKAKKGKEVGLQVTGKIKEGDLVYKIAD